MRLSIIPWLDRWPQHPAMSFLTWLLVLATGVIVLVHMTLAHHMPDGYGDWYILLGGLTGINVTSSTLRRQTDYEYQKLKNQAPAPTTVQAGGPTTVEVKPDV